MSTGHGAQEPGLNVEHLYPVVTLVRDTDPPITGYDYPVGSETASAIADD